MNEASRARTANAQPFSNGVVMTAPSISGVSLSGPAEFFPTKRYVFNKARIRIPRSLRVIIPREMREALLAACEAAGLAFRSLKFIDEHYSQRFYRLCPVDNVTRFENHCISIQLLFSWKVDYNPGDPTLAATPRFPNYAFLLHVNEEAYKQYAREHEDLRRQYIEGPHSDWRKRVQEFENMLEVSGIAEVDKRFANYWWHNDFLDEMKIWESRFEELDLPDWDDMIDDVAELLEEAAETGGGLRALPLPDLYNF